MLGVLPEVSVSKLPTKQYSNTAPALKMDVGNPVIFGKFSVKITQVGETGISKLLLGTTSFVSAGKALLLILLESEYL